MRFKRYVVQGLSGCALLVLACGAVNWIIDPYGVIGTGLVPGLNVVKPFAGDRGRIAKPYQVQRMNPKGLVVGNSRPEMGINPGHRCWPASARPVYNIALPGLPFHRQVQYAQHAITVGQVRAMVLAVDFIDFLVPDESVRNEGLKQRRDLGDHYLLSEPSDRASLRFQILKALDFAKSTFSLDALLHSAGTIVGQRNLTTSTRTVAGFNAADAYYSQLIRTEGTAVLFAQKNREVLSRLLTTRWDLYSEVDGRATPFGALRLLLRQTIENGIQVKLLINPYHAEYLTSIDLAGLWPLFEGWKREVTTIAAEFGNLPLWDFSGFDRFSTEPVAGLAVKNESMRWFWEPSHYRKELGDIMLENVWRESCANADTPFGHLLTPENIADHLGKQRRAKLNYIRSNPDVLRRLRAISKR